MYSFVFIVTMVLRPKGHLDWQWVETGEQPVLIKSVSFVFLPELY